MHWKRISVELTKKTIFVFAQFPCRVVNRFSGSVSLAASRTNLISNLVANENHILGRRLRARYGNNFLAAILNTNEDFAERFEIFDSDFVRLKSRRSSWYNPKHTNVRVRDLSDVIERVCSILEDNGGRLNIGTLGGQMNRLMQVIFDAGFESFGQFIRVQC